MSHVPHKRKDQLGLPTSELVQRTTVPLFKVSQSLSLSLSLWGEVGHHYQHRHSSSFINLYQILLPSPSSSSSSPTTITQLPLVPPFTITAAAECQLNTFVQYMPYVPYLWMCTIVTIHKLMASHPPYMTYCGRLLTTVPTFISTVTHTQTDTHTLFLPPCEQQRILILAWTPLHVECLQMTSS